MIEQIHQFIVQTEMASRELEVFKPTQPQREMTLWLPRENWLSFSNKNFKLIPITTQEHWAIMLELRREIEADFDMANEGVLAQIVTDIQTKTLKQNGQWFLARYQQVWVGEIGLIPFEFEGQKVGRIKDVDIIPSKQGVGLGRLLMQALCEYAQKNDFHALCLMALVDDWPSKWYQRLGFIPVGQALV